MAVIAGQSRLQKFGASPAGSLTGVVLVGPVLIAAPTAGFGNTNIPSMTDFGASVASGGAGSFFQLQISNDGIAWTEIDRIEIPNAGVVSVSYGKPIPICSGGQQFRVFATQSTAARMSARLFGSATNADIVDL
jgi:hypothetical protein